jgi:hypothetical protein
MMRNQTILASTDSTQKHTEFKDEIISRYQQLQIQSISNESEVNIQSPRNTQITINCQSNN